MTHLTTTPEIPKLLKAKEACILLNVSRDTLYRMAVAGSIKSIRVGQRGIRYTETSIVEYVEKQIAE